MNILFQQAFETSGGHLLKSFALSHVTIPQSCNRAPLCPGHAKQIYF